MRTRRSKKRPKRRQTGRERKRQRAFFDVESLVPNEVLAMILGFVGPADLPAARRVARRWSALAPPPEPDLVIAWVERGLASFVTLDVVPRHRLAQRDVARLYAETAGKNVDDDDDDGDDFRDALRAADGEPITLWQLAVNLRHVRRPDMFIVDVVDDKDEYDFSVRRCDDERDLADDLISEAHYRLYGDEHDDCREADCPCRVPDVIITDDDWRKASALVERACQLPP
jgi:hypothetical protein